MKSAVSAIAVSMLTAFAFTPSSLAGPVSARTLMRCAQTAPSLKTLIVLAQQSPEPGYASDAAADNQNEPADSADPDSSAQSDDQGNGDDAQNGDADNGDTDQNAQNADNADKSDSADSDNGDSVNAQPDSGDADQNADSSAAR